MTKNREEYLKGIDKQEKLARTMIKVLKDEIKLSKICLNLTLETAREQEHKDDIKEFKQELAVWRKQLPMKKIGNIACPNCRSAVYFDEKYCKACGQKVC